MPCPPRAPNRLTVTVTSVLQTTAGKMIFCRWPEVASFVEVPETRREIRPIERGRDVRNGREFRTGEIRRSDLDRERRDAGDRALPPGLMTEATGGGGSDARPPDTALAPAPPVAEALVPPPAPSGEVPAAKAD